MHSDRQPGKHTPKSTTCTSTDRIAGFKINYYQTSTCIDRSCAYHEFGACCGVHPPRGTVGSAPAVEITGGGTDIDGACDDAFLSPSRLPPCPFATLLDAAPPGAPGGGTILYRATQTSQCWIRCALIRTARTNQKGKGGGGSGAGRRPIEAGGRRPRNAHLSSARTGSTG